MLFSGSLHKLTYFDWLRCFPWKSPNPGRIGRTLEWDPRHYLAISVLWSDNFLAIHSLGILQNEKQNFNYLDKLRERKDMKWRRVLSWQSQFQTKFRYHFDGPLNFCTYTPDSAWKIQNRRFKIKKMEESGRVETISFLFHWISHFQPFNLFIFF